MIASIPPVSQPLKPLTRISPSRFAAFKHCQLKEVWAANGAQPSLPLHPSARLGNVIHKVLEKAGKEGIAGQEEFEEAWRVSVEAVESTMRALENEKHLVPLAISARYFEVKKNQCLKIVSAIQKKGVYRKLDGYKGHESGSENEMWLESQDRAIGGFVDRINQTESGAVIMDYKSGAVLDESMHGTAEQQVKEDYQVQLKLYAGIYSEKYGHSPALLQVIAIDGAVFDVSFDHAEGVELLESARNKLAEINSIILADSSQEGKILQLASPQPAICKSCRFRPACGPYISRRKEEPISSEWPTDFGGEINDKKTLGNGCLRIKMRLTNMENIAIRGLHLERHQALNSTTKEMWFFSLRPDSVAMNYLEGPTTAVFQGRSNP